MENYKKILKNSRKPLLIAVIIILVSIILFSIGTYLDSVKEKEAIAKDYNELIYYQKDVENEYVEVKIVDLPYGFATEEENNITRKYYFVFDEYDFMYIVRLTDSTYEMLEDIYNQNPEEFSYVLKGYIFESPADLKDLAISAYNEAMKEEIINNENFRLYFGNTYLDETLTPYTDISAILFGIGFGIDILALVFLSIYVIGFIKLKISLKKYYKDDLEYELSKETTIPYKKANIYLTDKYIISTEVGLTVLEYNELVWIHNEKRRYNGITIGTFIIGYTDNKKRYQIASVYTDENLLNEIMGKIKEKNPLIMVGFTKENQQKYKEIKKSK